MDSKIIDFLNKQNIASISVVDTDGNPYSFSCVYTFDEANECIYFKSSAAATRHGKILEKNNKVSGTILPDSIELINIRGIQLMGIVKKNSLFDVAAAMKYHAQHPMAAVVPGDMWTLQLSYIKFTDNSLGFGTKIEWEK